MPLIYLSFFGFSLVQSQFSSESLPAKEIYFTELTDFQRHSFGHLCPFSSELGNEAIG